MKNKLNFYFFVFSFLILGNTTSLVAQACKIETGPFCKEENLSIVFNLPGYSDIDCIIFLKYKRRVCNGVYNIFDLAYVPLGNCGDFKTRMMTDSDFARDVDVLAGRQISDIIAQQVVFGFGANPKQYICGANPAKVVQVSYVRGSCIAIWSGKTTVEIPVPGTQQVIVVSGEPGGLSYLTTIQLSIPSEQEVLATVACGDGCCKLTRTYCNDNGKLSAKEEATSANPAGEFCSFVVPDPPVFFDERFVTWLSSSPCYTPCNNLPSGNKIAATNSIKTDRIMNFKNPTDGNLEVLLGKEVEGSIEVVSMEGKVIKQVTLTRNKAISIDLTATSVGIYSIRLTQNDGQIETQKLIHQ